MRITKTTFDPAGLQTYSNTLTAQLAQVAQALRTGQGDKTQLTQGQTLITQEIAKVASAMERMGRVKQDVDGIEASMPSIQFRIFIEIGTTTVDLLKTAPVAAAPPTAAPAAAPAGG